MSATAAKCGLVATIRRDLHEMAMVKAIRYPSLKGLVDVLMLPGTWTVIVFRTAHHLHALGLRPLSRILYFANLVLFGADIDPSTQFGPGLVIPHPVAVRLGGGATFGDRVRVLGSVSVGGSADPGRSGAPIIGDDVWLMDSAKVFGPVTIGDRSLVGAMAVVTKDVPSDTFLFGPRGSTDMRPLADLGLADHHERDSHWRPRAEAVVAS